MPDKTDVTQTGDTATEEQDQGQGNQNGDSTTDTEKRYTEAEVRKLMQSESDRRVTDALKKKEKEIADLKHAMELEKLSAEERKEAERKQREEELEEERKKLEADKLDYETIRHIADKKFEPALIEFVQPLGSMEERKKALTLFEKLVKTEVENRLKEMQKGSFPTEPQKKGSKYVDKRPKETVFDKAKKNL